MDLLTVSTESALTEEWNYQNGIAYGKCILAANFGFCGAHSTLLGIAFYAYKASAEVQRLHLSREW